MIYCTLFDSNYSDKGIAMIKSLLSVDKEANIYVLCMDDLCYDILFLLQLPGVCLITLSDFLDEKLATLKRDRSRAEFCWTCTAQLIKYVLMTFQHNICTYVDSDLLFYTNPSVLIEEMREAGCCVQVVPHWFTNSYSGKKQALFSGKYCVQFNTFTTDEPSMNLLNSWIEQCYQECSFENVGDQKYTDKWDQYSFVNVTCNRGAGLAPWNINRYQLVDWDKHIVHDKYEKKEYQIIFYHYQNITYLDRYIVRIAPPIQYWKIDNTLIEKLYMPYLQLCENEKKRIEEIHSFLPLIKVYSADENNKKEKKNSERKKHWKLLSPMAFLNRVNNFIKRKIKYKKSILFINKETL